LGAEDESVREQERETHRHAVVRIVNHE